jgi:hypothetical protein
MGSIQVELNWEVQGVISKDNIDNLPTYSGIYIVLCAEKNDKNEWKQSSYKLIYIGEAEDIKDRFAKRTDDEWKCLTDNCNKSLMVKTTKTDLVDDKREKVECCLINHNGDKLSKCQTECVENWPHEGDTIEITNSGSYYPLKENYKCE